MSFEQFKEVFKAYQRIDTLQKILNATKIFLDNDKQFFKISFKTSNQLKNLSLLDLSKNTITKIEGLPNSTKLIM